jgi:hypothetical protein
VAAVCIVAFAAQQHWALFVDQANRLFPVHLLADPEYWVLFATTATAMGSMYLVAFFVPLFFQFAQADSALRAGVKLLPALCTLSAGVMISGAVTGRRPVYLPWYALGSTMMLSGGVLLYVMQASTSSSYVM